jgi:hypothetical protein
MTRCPEASGSRKKQSEMTALRENGRVWPQYVAHVQQTREPVVNASFFLFFLSFWHVNNRHVFISTVLSYLQGGRASLFSERGPFKF